MLVVRLGPDGSRVTWLGLGGKAAWPGAEALSGNLARSGGKAAWLGAVGLAGNLARTWARAARPRLAGLSGKLPRPVLLTEMQGGWVKERERTRDLGSRGVP